MEWNGKIVEDTKEIKEVYMEHYKELLATAKAYTQIEIDAEEKVNRVTKSCKSIAYSRTVERFKIEDLQCLPKVLGTFRPFLHNPHF